VDRGHLYEYVFRRWPWLLCQRLMCCRTIFVFCWYSCTPIDIDNERIAASNRKATPGNLCWSTARPTEKW